MQQSVANRIGFGLFAVTIAQHFAKGTIGCGMIRWFIA
jgi:hypothetical protein